MIKTFMLIWATAANAEGNVVAGGLTSQFVTQEECNIIKSRADYAVDVLCIPLDGSAPIVRVPKVPTMPATIPTSTNPAADVVIDDELELDDELSAPQPEPKVIPAKPKVKAKAKPIKAKPKVEAVVVPAPKPVAKPIKAKAKVKTKAKAKVVSVAEPVVTPPPVKKKKPALKEK